MRRAAGLTLIEALIALAIFGMVTVMATIGITSALRTQSLNEAITSSQERLRRVTEVFTQELRSAVLGGVSNAPYVSNDHQVSFITLTGGAGDPVLPHDYGSTSSFAQADDLFLLWGDPNTSASVLQGQHILLTNGNGDAIVFKVTGVTLQSDGSYDVVHTNCPNTIAYTDTRTMTMTSRAIGFRFDSASGNLYMTEGTSPEVPVAFNLASVRIQYVYQKDDGTMSVLTAPLTNAAGTPVRSGTIGTQNATLVRVGLVLSASSGTVQRHVSGSVEMASSHSFTINQVTTCD
jgi:type II secretory pathway pseudopilin PulG